MMSLRVWLLGLFQGASSRIDGELQSVREAARRDARLVAGAYVEEFELEAAKVFSAGTQRLLGVDLPPEGKVLDAEPERPDYSSWKRPALMREAKARDLVVSRRDTKDELVRMIQEDDEDCG